MGFRTFVGIAIAVALGVSRGLKIHEDPEGFSDFITGLLKLVWGVIKYIGLPLLVLGLIILGVEWMKDSVDIDKVLTWICYIIIILFIGCFIYGFGRIIYERFKKAKENLKGKKGFMDMCKELFRERKEDRKKKKEAKAKKIAEMSEEELKRYKKNRKDIIIIIICLSIVLAPGIIISILNLFGANI